jgi:hypothetical protein
MKIVCDGCGTDARSLCSDFMPSTPTFSPLGQPGDGLSRQLELRLGKNKVLMDLCFACHQRARSWLVEAFPEMARTRKDWWRAMAPDEPT